MAKLEPCAEQLKLVDDFTKLIVAPACGQALENATKLVTVFPVAVLTTITPLSSMKSLTNSSWEDKFTVSRTFVGGGIGIIVVIVVVRGVVPSSLEHACIMQLMQVR